MPRGSKIPFPWTEEKQAKWALRRLLGDLSRDIYSSYFSICDMHYTKGINYKGLLATNADQTVHHRKKAYYAVQCITAIFDNRVHRVKDFAGSVQGAGQEGTYSLFAYRTESGLLELRWFGAIRHAPGTPPWPPGPFRRARNDNSSGDPVARPPSAATASPGPTT